MAVSMHLHMRMRVSGFVQCALHCAPRQTPYRSIVHPSVQTIKAHQRRCKRSGGGTYKGKKGLGVVGFGGLIIAVGFYGSMLGSSSVVAHHYQPIHALCAMLRCYQHEHLTMYLGGSCFVRRSPLPLILSSPRRVFPERVLVQIGSEGSRVDSPT